MLAFLPAMPFTRPPPILTKAEERFLSGYRDLQARLKRPPTLRELANEFDFHDNSARYYRDRLLLKGFLAEWPRKVVVTELRLTQKARTLLAGAGEKRKG